VELLRTRECVIIPGFGGFVARYAPARLHPVDHTIFPPSKTVVFNPGLRSNDTLLASRLMETEQISWEEAMNRVTAFGNHCSRIIRNREILMLPGLGKLFLDPEGEIRFVQDKLSNLLPEACGLPVLTLKPVLRRQQQRKAVKAVKETGRNLAVRTMQARARTIAVAAVLALLVGFSGLWLYNGNIGQSATQFVEYLIGPDTGALQEYRPYKQPAPALFGDENLQMAFPDTAYLAAMIRILAEPVIDNTATLPELATYSPPSGYYIVVGSFTRSRNAEQLKQELTQKGYDAYILQAPNGFQRVGIFTSHSEQEALNSLPAIREQINSGAWIHHL